MFVNKINNRFHLFKWADGSALEEIEDMKMKFFNLERASRSLVKDNKNFNSELEILIMDTCACESVVTGLEKELRGFEKELQDSKMEVKGIKNMIVCAAMAIRSYFGVFMMYFGDDHL
ncbi:hypothetical protein HID58_061536 [Brassica napus]|uniref:Uncharacterized protein n=1 Tax=Brassica napus TaxID=3708 RepID=A0ABQ7ZYV2_BRANA|nr:hypothetical protein HID58_061536 [Brassica napus]